MYKDYKIFSAESTECPTISFLTFLMAIVLVGTPSTFLELCNRRETAQVTIINDTFATEGLDNLGGFVFLLIWKIPELIFYN